jgi:hypothetical protein
MDVSNRKIGTSVFNDFISCDDYTIQSFKDFIVPRSVAAPKFVDHQLRAVAGFFKFSDRI